jgi:hypothetical protein
MGIILMIFGGASIVCGFLARSFWGNWTFSDTADDIPLPHWVGRAIFSLVGMLFVAVGLLLLWNGF